MQASRIQVAKLSSLVKRADFLRIQSTGQKWVAQGFVFQVLPNDGQGIRFGLTASKRLDKSAVVRNRIRRRLRAAVRDVLADGAKDNTDYVLIGRTQTATRAYGDLKRDLRWCLKKTGSGV